MIANFKRGWTERVHRVAIVSRWAHWRSAEITGCFSAQRQRSSSTKDVVWSEHPPSTCMYPALKPKTCSSIKGIYIYTYEIINHWERERESSIQYMLCKVTYLVSHIPIHLNLIEPELIMITDSQTEYINPLENSIPLAPSRCACLKLLASGVYQLLPQDEGTELPLVSCGALGYYCWWFRNPAITSWGW